jgi:hypothetical protein
MLLDHFHLIPQSPQAATTTPPTAAQTPPQSGPGELLVGGNSNGVAWRLQQLQLLTFCQLKG